ncbi:hypothetical protein N0V93_004403 [Gnomoniopsis smithogilvyi]|uniref:Protein kinase domain-containing protein n=1 Tax=Gnomoniopsis smithogilvyi TaxID=1191159 RepID=A0A9W8YTN5_9PEZI|nr:hypothetical protein N0V93_004403 [Gnomoniopsis smithogilvyi]
MTSISSQPDGGDDPESLANKIEGIMVNSVFGRPETFAPQDALTEIISPTNQALILRALGLPAGANNAIVDDYILKRAQKLFAISIYGCDFEGTDLLTLMNWFEKHDFSDQSLPILKSTFENHKEFWKPNKIRNFCTYQHEFIAPIFSVDEDACDLTEESILPFTKKFEESESGSFGCVSKWAIHRSHLVHPRDDNFRCPEVVAIKRLLYQGKITHDKLDAAWRKEATMLQRMSELKEAHIVQLYTAFRRGTGISREYFLLLEWASGGNLRTLWEKLPRTELTSILVKSTVKQLQGLADALSKAHYPGGKLNYRHGDLKPENILWFKNDEPSFSFGTLKIGDWGLAKEQEHVTELRSKSTISPPGTRRYESPEESIGLGDHGSSLSPRADTVQQRKRRSRLYDTWAMGCISLEFLIWLAYGQDELQRFNQSFKGPYYEVQNGVTAVVKDKVTRYIQRMEIDPAFKVGETALGDLLELVRDNLLVVKLPQRFATWASIIESNVPPSETDPLMRPVLPTTSVRPPRAALPSHTLPAPIIVLDPSAVVQHEGTATLPSDRQMLKAPGPERAHAKRFQDLMTIISTNDDPESYWYQSQPEPLGNSIANGVNPVLGGESFATSRASRIVGNRLLSPDQHVSLSHFRTEVRDYGQTELDNYWNVCIDLEIAKKVQLAGGLDHPSPVTHIHPYETTTSKLCIECHKAQSDLCVKPFSVSYKWKYLEGKPSDKHNGCDLCAFFWQFRNQVQSTAVHVTFQRDESLLRIVDCPTPLMSFHVKTGPKFCTTIENKRDFIDNGIRLDDLPATFKDAVKATRAIGHPYLWIDSICIVQGEGGDFEEQSTRMGHVYSGAYCVLAACRSPGHYAGFLAPRPELASIALRGESGPYYISRTVDDFEGHVLQGSLNKRAWVLQEHALARRTLYFTDHQAYFECGDGVRCESLMKMTNPSASLLGDSNFPKSIMNSVDRAEKILHFQKLYQDYSRLGLSNPTDRPLAIGGLQERILNALNARGGFGVLDEETPERGGHSSGRGLLRRSLLWCRGTDEAALRAINFLSDHALHKVPSWSWMAYEGGIDYLSPEFGQVDWTRVVSPWFPEVKAGSTTLSMEAQDYHSNGCPKGQCRVVLDVGDPDGNSQIAPGMCVILGIDKPGVESMLSSGTSGKHYVLALRQKVEQDSSGGPVYQRVGAGYLLEECVGTNTVSVEIH